MSSDTKIVKAGKAAWLRIKKSNAFADWLAIGRALLVGRRLCMKKCGVDRPRGGNYVKANGEWLKATGFTEIAKAARATAML